MSKKLDFKVWMVCFIVIILYNLKNIICGDVKVKHVADKLITVSSLSSHGAVYNISPWQLCMSSSIWSVCALHTVDGKGCLKKERSLPNNVMEILTGFSQSLDIHIISFHYIERIKTRHESSFLTLEEGVVWQTISTLSAVITQSSPVDIRPYIFCNLSQLTLGKRRGTP